MVKFIFFIALLSVGNLFAYSQITEPKFVLPVFNDSLSLTDIIRQTEELPDNSQKVRQLIAIMHICFNHGRGPKILDSCVTYLKEALVVGLAIHDTLDTDEALEMLCVTYMNKDQISHADALLSGTQGKIRVRLLITIADAIVGRQPTINSYLQKSVPYLSAAFKLADSLHSIRWRYECLMVQAKYLFECNDIDAGRDAILKIIRSCDSVGDKKGVGNYWSEMNKYMPMNAKTSSYHFFAIRQSIKAFTDAGDQHDALYALRDMAVVHRFLGQYDSAKAEFGVFLRETAKTGTKPSGNTNFQLSALYTESGDPATGLDYCLRALGQAGRDDHFKVKIYEQLAEIYQLTGMVEGELSYGRLAADNAVRFQAPERHYFTTFVVEALVRQGHPDSALAYIHEFIQSNPVLINDQKEAIAYDYGLIYDALGAYDRAAPWFRKLAVLDIDAQQERNSMVWRRFGLDPFLVNLYIGRFYVHWGKYGDARPFLERALANAEHYKGYNDGGELQLLLYKADSAERELKAALDHQAQYIAVRDSMFNVKKLQQFQTLEVQFQSKQREQSIRLLQSERQGHLAQLSEASLVRKIEFGGIVVLLIAAAWAYYAYRSKRRNVVRLVIQQGVINEKNLALEKLIGEKNELLIEKNLLLQEVHHRVKNNLHTVMSLLESQTAYLTDPAGRNALVDGQNRIHTISLLHQKLYWNANVTTLEMAPYISELSAFLASSLGATERRIIISQSLDPILLDIAIGLPIGLLLNEAITNSLKHAFPENTDRNAPRAGHIEITLRSYPDGRVSLRVMDDGVGMPPGAEDRSQSLGMTLMKSIGQKLGGAFDIQSSDKGVVVMTEFVPVHTLSEVLS